MAIAAYQEILALLYTDPRFREAFFLDRHRVFMEYEIDENERAHLLALSHEQVESFALSLVRKRMHEVCDQLPCTAKKMGTEFNRLFFDYAKGYVPSGVNKHLEDAIRFGDYIIAQGKDEKEISTIAKFESNRVRRFISKRKFIIEIYRLPVTALIRSIMTNTSEVKAKKREVNIYFRGNVEKTFFQWRFFL